MIWVALLGDAARLRTIHWQTIQATKKKAVVAIARQLAVYLWRVFTGQVEAEKFGLVYLPEAARASKEAHENEPSHENSI